MKRYITKFILLIAISLNLHASEAEDIQELRDDVDKILKRVDSYEKKNITDDASGYKAPMDQKGSLELTTADTVLSVGGRIQLDAIYASPEGPHFAKAIPIGEQVGEDGQIVFSSQYSRLWVKTRTPSEYGTVRALIETDFLGTAGTETNVNAHGIRLRHSYVQVGGWSIGQTNSAFNADVTLDIIITAINDTFVRQPLIRYQYENELFSYALSFEQPETTLLDPDANIITPKDDVVPDVIARIIHYPRWGELGLSMMGRYIVQDHATLSDDTDLTNKDSAFGWGANLSGKVKVFELDDIRFAAHYGDGIGRYLAYDAYPAGVITSSGEINLQTSFGGHIGYRHWWNHKLRSTISYSYAATENNLDNLNNLNLINKDARSTQLNLFWMPIPNSLVGVEYASAKRKVESDEEGKIQMLNLIFRYDF